MKRIVAAVSLLFWAGAAHAQEFEIFGLTLADFSLAEQNRLISQQQQGGPGLRHNASMSGAYIYMSEAELNETFVAFGEDYDLYKDYTDDDHEVARKYRALQYYPQPGFPAPFPRTLRPNTLYDFDDADLNTMLAESRQLNQTHWASWYYCRVNLGSPACPDDMVTTNVSYLYALRPSGGAAPTDAVRFVVIVETPFSFDEAANVLRSAYPDAAVSYADWDNRSWVVFTGENEVMGTDGTQFFVQVGPERFQEIYAEPILNLKTRSVALFEQIEARGRALQKAEADARVGAITGN